MYKTEQSHTDPYGPGWNSTDINREMLTQCMTNTGYCCESRQADIMTHRN